MSNDKITIIPPDGYEAVQHEDGTVTFQVKTVTPGFEALNITHSKPWSSWRYEVFAGTREGWEPWEANIDPAKYANDPRYRNFVPQRELVVKISHPSEARLDEAVEWLEDYLDNYLGDEERS